MKKNIQPIKALMLLASISVVGITNAQTSDDRASANKSMTNTEILQFQTRAKTSSPSGRRASGDLSVNTADATQTILRFSGTPRSDLPAFNFTAVTTDYPCKENCTYNWVINQGTKLVLNKSGSANISDLKPDTNYRVDWIKADLKNPRLIREIKLLK